MKKLILVMISILMFASVSFGDYWGPVKITELRIQGKNVFLGTSTVPANVCSNWGESFRFDHTTPEGKSYLAALLSAKSSSSNITLWYSPAAVTGACGDAAGVHMAKLSGVALP